MPGLKILEKDREAIDVKFFCAMCTLLLVSPMQTSCGHLICLVCVEEILRRDDPTCPADGTVLTRAEVFPDAFTKRELMGIHLHCPNEGCGWSGKYKDFQEEHNKNCNFILIACVHEQCKTKLLRSQLALHLERDCEYRQITCKFCKQQQPYALLKEHIDKDCASKPMKCKHCGKDGIPRNQLNEHETRICDELPVSCHYVAVGCTTQVSKRKLAEHLTRSFEAHLLLVYNRVMELMQNGLRTVDDLQIVKENVTSLREDTQATQGLVRSVQTTVRRMNEDGATSTSSGHDKHGSDIRKLQRQVVELISKNSEIVEKNRILEEKVAEKTRENNRLKTKVEVMDESLTLTIIKLNDLSKKSAAEGPPISYNGTLLWRIEGFQEKRQEAVAGKQLAIYSPHFYSSQFGYKMCVRVYMNGDGFGKGTHISLFFVVMKGEYDALLPWPFQKKITMMILDQVNGDHMIDAFRSDPDSSSFQRPKNKMNIASGSPLFLPLDTLANRAYVKDDTMFVKVIVD